MANWSNNPGMHIGLGSARRQLNPAPRSIVAPGGRRREQLRASAPQQYEHRPTVNRVAVEPSYRRIIWDCSLPWAAVLSRR